MAFNGAALKSCGFFSQASAIANAPSGLRAWPEDFGLTWPAVCEGCMLDHAWINAQHGTLHNVPLQYISHHFSKVS